MYVCMRTNSHERTCTHTKAPCSLHPPPSLPLPCSSCWYFYGQNKRRDKAGPLDMHHWVVPMDGRYFFFFFPDIHSEASRPDLRALSESLAMGALQRDHSGRYILMVFFLSSNRRRFLCLSVVLCWRFHERRLRFLYLSPARSHGARVRTTYGSAWRGQLLLIYGRFPGIRKVSNGGQVSFFIHSEYRASNAWPLPIVQR